MREEGEEEEEDEMRDLEVRIEKAHLPGHALKAAQKELKVHCTPSVYYERILLQYFSWSAQSKNFQKMS